MRQGLLSEPQASSGPAAMLLAVSRSPSSIPPTESLPGAMPPSSGVPQPHPPLKTSKTSPPASTPGPMPPFSGVPLHPNKKNGTRQFQHCQTPEPKHPSNRHIQYIINIRYLLNSITTRKFSQQLKIAGLHFNIRSQLLTLRTNIRHLKNAPLTNPTP